MATPHDTLFRKAIARTEDVAAWLANLLRDALGRVVAVHLTPLRTEHPAGDDATTRADAVFEATLDGQPAVILLVLELQVRAEPDMSLRMLRYGAASLHDWRRHHPEGPLPAMIGLVAYVGDRPWAPSLHLAQTSLPPDLDALLRPFFLTLQVLILDLARQPVWSLQAPPPLRVVWALLVRRRRGGLLHLLHDHRLDARAALTAHGVGWLEDVIGYVRSVEPRRPTAAEIAMLAHDLEVDEEQIKSWADLVREDGFAEGEAKGKAEGEAKGKAEGEAKGKAELLLTLGALRWGPPTATTRARVAAADVALLDRWALALLGASGWDELLAS